MRNYKRKTERGQTPKDDMKGAAEDVINGALSLRKAADAFNVNFMKLQRYVKKVKTARNEGKNESEIHVGYAKARQLFSEEKEQALVDYIKHSAKIFYGLTTTDVKSLAYDYGNANNISLPIKWHENKSASKDWLISFMKRNPTLAIRTPEKTSLGRMTKLINTCQNFLIIYILYTRNITSAAKTCGI